MPYPALTLSDHQFAHRGLWDASTPENSLAAFRNAVEEGFGAECDVHVSSDGVAMVFHDFDLPRMTGQSGKIGELTAIDLSKLRLKATDEPIPTLADLLNMMGSKPLLIELKFSLNQTDAERLVAAVFRDIANHSGPVALMSFSDEVLDRIADHTDRPLTGCLLDPAQSPDFEKLAAEYAAGKFNYLGPNIKAAQATHGNWPSEPPPMAAWTVRTKDELALACELGIAPIFEKLDPALVRTHFSA